MPFKGFTFRNPNVIENYENLDSAGPYIAEELPITSSVLFPVDSGASAQTSTADAGRSVHSVLSKSQSSSTSSTYIAELEQDFASKARRNDDTMLNSIPDLKNFLENGVDNGILTYEKSLVLERDNEIMAAMEMYADEFSVIHIFLHRKFPELNKFNTTSVDISTTSCFLILCDYLTRRDGCIPQFLTYKEGPEYEDEELSSSTKSSDDFDVFTRDGLRGHSPFKIIKYIFFNNISKYMQSYVKFIVESISGICF